MRRRLEFEYCVYLGRHPISRELAIGKRFKRKDAKMGYGSDVRIVTTKKGYKFLCEKIDEYEKAHPDVVKLVGTDITQDYYEEFGDDVVFGWDYVEWSSLYPEVTAFEDALGMLDKEEIPYEFCRVGEDYDDIEEYGRDDDRKLNIHVGTSVIIDVYQ